MVKEFSEELELVLKIFGIIASIFGAIVVIRKGWKAYSTRMNYFFHQQWTNEGSVGEPQPTHYIMLNITCDGSDIGGHVEVRKLGTEETVKGGIVGKRRFYFVFLDIIYVRHGNVSSHGRILLKKKGKLLKWKTKESYIGDGLPAKALLFH